MDISLQTFCEMDISPSHVTNHAMYQYYLNAVIYV